jgi:polyhydroxyalkanoate synthesis regulator phasin
MFNRAYFPVIAAALCLLTATFARAEGNEDLAVVRNTVINILEAMVQKGLLTREQADQLVQKAQQKAEAEQAAANKEQAPKPDDVRVTYVPETVRAQIGQEVTAAVKDEVTKSVVATARTEGWGIPAALPEWVRTARWAGDIRVRGVGVFFDSANIPNTYLDFQKINESGGIGKAGADAFLNVTENEQRIAARLRFGGDFTFGSYATAGFRISTGTTRNPVSLDQDLADYGRSSAILLSEAYIRYALPLTVDDNVLSLTAGRMQSPFQATEMVWDQDLRFSGVAIGYALRSGRDGLARGPFVTAGVFPLKSIALSARDKWLWGGQLGWEQGFGRDLKLSFAGAYYQFENVTGQANAPDSNLLDYTAPEWLQKGNTLFDIRNSTDKTLNLYALAADYHLLDGLVQLSWLAQPDLQLRLAIDYVKNIGYDSAAVQARTGRYVAPRTTGYRVELRAGSPDIRRRWDWGVFGGYESLERDAVLDAFTDSDFHRGGTDARGYFIGGDLGLSDHTWLRVRYMSADAIDGGVSSTSGGTLPLGIDLLYLDLNASF